MKDKEIWRTEKMLVKLVDDGDLLRISNFTEYIYLLVPEMTAFAMEWLGTHGFEVTKRKPEPLPCPNPLCDGNEYDVGVSKKKSNWFVFCHRCAMRGGAYPDRLKAIEAWNALPRVTQAPPDTGC